MNIAPNLGIGDLLILKMQLISNNVSINHLYVRQDIITQYRLDPAKYIHFLEYLLHKLFPETIIHMNTHNNPGNVISEYGLNATYLRDYYIFDNEFQNEYGNYIIFHTKARFDYCSGNFKALHPILIDFFKHFKTHYTIIILGEKHVEQNIEAITHNITSLYEIMMLMKTNNNVIDLTYHSLYSGNNVYDFEKDLFLINNAKLNVGFGYGGPLNICQAFSKNNCFYIDKLQHKIVNYYKNINNNVYDDIHKFIEEIVNHSHTNTILDEIR